jgi:hypothetical protein
MLSCRSYTVGARVTNARGDDVGLPGGYPEDNLRSMERIADRKLHFAPFERQMKAIRKLLREGRHETVTELLRAAVDHYLDAAGRPPLSEQARQMAEDYERTSGRSDADALQAPSMTSDEDW